MKSLKLILAISISLAAGFTAVNAQERLRKNERWCLESRESRGGSPLLCRFVSYNQCMQSKTTIGDRCMQNPGWR
jgi:hypothetical protein